MQNWADIRDSLHLLSGTFFFPFLCFCLLHFHAPLCWPTFSSWVCSMAEQKVAPPVTASKFKSPTENNPTRVAACLTWSCCRLSPFEVQSAVHLRDGGMGRGVIIWLEIQFFDFLFPKWVQAESSSDKSLYLWGVAFLLAPLVPACEHGHSSHVPLLPNRFSVLRLLFHFYKLFSILYL